MNASRVANRVSVCGDFINITQNSKKVVFVGTFTSGGLKTSIDAARLVIEWVGKHLKFLAAIYQITFFVACAASRRAAR